MQDDDSDGQERLEYTTFIGDLVDMVDLGAGLADVLDRAEYGEMVRAFGRHLNLTAGLRHATTRDDDADGDPLRPAAEPTLAGLVALANAGDQDAWRQIVERCSRLVWLVARAHRLRAAFAELPHRCQQMLALTAAAPELSYVELSAALDIPIGAIGPARARCLAELRRRLSTHDLTTGDSHVE